MTSFAHRNGIGVPAGAAKAGFRLFRVNPLRSELAAARKMGFTMLMHHDHAERTVLIRLLADTQEAREAVQRASGDPELNSVEAGISYGFADDPIEAMQACAMAALQMARSALS